jgi:hypothetical protein
MHSRKPRFLDGLGNGNPLSYFTSVLTMEWLNIFTSRSSAAFLIGLKIGSGSVAE